MIHPTAIIASEAQIDEQVSIGPYCVIEGPVKISKGSKLDSHVYVSGPTTIGENNRFFPFSSIGAEPQDKKYAGEPTELIIGNGNTFRENITINRGTIQDTGKTIIGDDNWVMANVHIAHDCRVGNHTILANAVALAGHVTVNDWAILGGYTLVHQFCAIGEHSFCGMGSVINQDVPNFVIVSGNIATARGVNTEGLKRRDFSEDQIRLVRKAYRKLYKANLGLQSALETLEEMNDSLETLSDMINFIRKSQRGIIR
ncbi:acyl-ACP--UDP-N-acetylglucosamine O-acyltransferase [Thiomicrorhabdus indica]|uniref:acyl-ACP--UDP-N-acetylglucosamine O-acyltransferase n=1 Tax=Thiomicrorhabdus indica TaxID=2267253 RepID=UPI002AA7E173|nr:acyl-ACP--UDP-N-acetylglucosamine O-acyltransferase [Thiomicrorhabdus indica]